jgi:hypothetical protein
MKLNIKNILTGLLFAVVQNGYGQGFVNLDFESAQIIPASGSLPNGIDTTNALPGWTIFVGATRQSQITYNNPALGATWVYLNATNGANISGNFSVVLQGGLSASAASITQTGLVPASAMSLFFEAQPSVGTLQVSLGGQNLSFIALSVGVNYTLYAADISAFAGQTQQLTFSALQDSQHLYNNWNIDNIQFSSTAVPEPGTLALVGLGSALLAARQWRKFCC